jgi:HlyD family secretion protein
MKLTIIVILIAIASLLGACGKKSEAEIAKQEALKADSLKKAKTTNERVLGVARIEPEDGIINITAGTSGKVLAVLVKENQEIEIGQAILNIEKVLENAQLGQAKSKISTQKAAIEANRGSIEALRVSFRNARDTYERNVKLYEAKAQTKQALDDSKAAMDKLEKDIETSKSNLEQSNRVVAELEADINYYKTILNQKSVIARVNGKILSLPIKTGEYVNNDTKIAEFAPSGAYIAKTEVDELFADRIKLGQKAYLFSQATGDTLASGIVSFAAEYLKAKSLFKDQSAEQEDRRVREVHIRLEGGKKPLIGSRVDCLILLKTQ